MGSLGYSLMLEGHEGVTWAQWLAIAGTCERLGFDGLSPVTFRLPAVLAKAATTVDRISGGRAQLGVGAGLVGPGAPVARDPLPLDPRTVRDAR